jgi:hypothetical protein
MTNRWAWRQIGWGILDGASRMRFVGARPVACAGCGRAIPAGEPFAEASRSRPVHRRALCRDCAPVAPLPWERPRRE